MFPCLIVDRSEEGFRLRGNFSLKRGQLIELVLDDPWTRCGAKLYGSANQSHSR
jgi:hypothetical protein